MQETDVFNQHTGIVFPFPSAALAKREADPAQSSHKPFSELEAVREHRARQVEAADYSRRQRLMITQSWHCSQLTANIQSIYSWQASYNMRAIKNKQEKQ